MTETVPQARGLWQSLGGGQNTGHRGGCHARPALTPAFHDSSCRPAWPQGHQPRETPWPTGSGPARHGPGEGRAPCRVPQLRSKMQKRGSSVCHFPHRPQTEPRCHLSCGLATNTVATMPVTRAHASPWPGREGDTEQPRGNRHSAVWTPRRVDQGLGQSPTLVPPRPPVSAQSWPRRTAQFRPCPGAAWHRWPRQAHPLLRALGPRCWAPTVLATAPDLTRPTVELPVLGRMGTDWAQMTSWSGLKPRKPWEGAPRASPPRVAR